MNKMTEIPLGANAFDEKKEIFRPVNIDREKKEISKQGSEDGAGNFPASKASTLGVAEQNIVSLVTQTTGQTKNSLAKHFFAYNSRLSPIEAIREPQAKIQELEQIKNTAVQKLGGKLTEFKNAQIIKKEEWQNEQRAYKKFRDHHDLTRSASYLPLITSFIWFVVIVVIEASLNATLLWELTGFLLAFGQTLLITCVNVVIGAAGAGLFFRYKNLVSSQRWLAWTCVPIVLAILVFNLGVGHYRDALTAAKAREEQQLMSPFDDWDSASYESVTEEFIDYTQVAMQEMVSAPLELDSVLSVLLIIVGLGFFAFASNKWYSMHDPCPSYRKRNEKLKTAHECYDNLINTTEKKIKQEIKNAQERVEDELTKVVNIRNQCANLIKRNFSITPCIPVRYWRDVWPRPAVRRRRGRACATRNPPLPE